MSPLLAEVVGTMILIVFGDGVVANVVLHRTKGPQLGMDRHHRRVGVRRHGCCVLRQQRQRRAPHSRRHDCARLYRYICVVEGADVHRGADRRRISWRRHRVARVSAALERDPGPESRLGVFSSTPAIRARGPNLVSEIIGGFALVLVLLAVLSPGNFVPGSDPLAQHARSGQPAEAVTLRQGRSSRVLDRRRRGSHDSGGTP